MLQVLSTQYQLLCKCISQEVRQWMPVDEPRFKEAFRVSKQLLRDVCDSELAGASSQFLQCN